MACINYNSTGVPNKQAQSMLYCIKEYKQSKDQIVQRIFLSKLLGVVKREKREAIGRLLPTRFHPFY